MTERDLHVGAERVSTSVTNSAQAWWGLDLTCVWLGTLGLGLLVASQMGIWSPWEAQVAQALEEMWSAQSWLTLRWLRADAQGFEGLPILPFGWSLSALCYGLLPTELGLRLPHITLTSLCALAVYSVTRRCVERSTEGSARGGDERARGSALIAVALWLATPASLFGGYFALNGLGGLLTSLACLWWLTPLSARRGGSWVGSALWLSAALSSGLFGLLSPVITLWGGARLTSSTDALGARPALRRLVGPLCVTLAGLLVAAWRLSVKSEPLAQGDLKVWLEMWTLYRNPFVPFEPTAYQGFQGATHLLAYAIFPVGLLLPSALVELLGGRGETRGRGVALTSAESKARDLGGLLTAWAGFSFLGLALSGAYSQGAGGLASTLAAPASIAAALYLPRLARRPSLALNLTGALFLLLVLSDVKRSPGLLLSSLVGQEVEGLDERLTAWRPLIALGYVGLFTLLSLFTPAQVLLSRLAWRVKVTRGSLVELGQVLMSLWALGLVLAMTWLSLGLSEQLSQRDLIDRYQALARPDEPLALYNMSAREAADSYYLRRLKEAPRDALAQAAKSEERSFFIIKRAELSALNASFRRTSGRHLSVLDDSSHELLLISNVLRAGERDLNPIGSAVIQALPEGAQRFKEPFVFGDKVELVAWSLEPGALRRGAEARLKLYWRALKKMRRSWKVFGHIDASNQRIHADHQPVEGLYPTRDWKVGDLIQDVHPFKVKSSISSDIFKVYVGLYQGKTRLELKGGEAKLISKDDRALLGRVRVY